MSNYQLGVFSATSPVVFVQDLFATKILNPTHPYIEALLRVPDKYVAGRQRALEAVTKPYDHVDLREVTRALGSAVGDDVLLRYAAVVPRVDQYRGQKSLRLARLS